LFVPVNLFAFRPSFLMVHWTTKMVRRGGLTPFFPCCLPFHLSPLSSSFPHEASLFQFSRGSVPGSSLSRPAVRRCDHRHLSVLMPNLCLRTTFEGTGSNLVGCPKRRGGRVFPFRYTALFFVYSLFFPKKTPLLPSPRYAPLTFLRGRLRDIPSRWMVLGHPSADCRTFFMGNHIRATLGPVFFEFVQSRSFVKSMPGAFSAASVPF